MPKKVEFTVEFSVQYMCMSFRSDKLSNAAIKDDIWMLYPVDVGEVFVCRDPKRADSICSVFATFIPECFPVPVPQGSSAAHSCDLVLFFCGLSPGHSSFLILISHTHLYVNKESLKKCQKILRQQRDMNSKRCTNCWRAGHTP